MGYLLIGLLRPISRSVWQSTRVCVCVFVCVNEEKKKCVCCVCVCVCICVYVHVFYRACAAQLWVCSPPPVCYAVFLSFPVME